MTKIWIDAAGFDDYGGFYLETQFVQEMGQAYLLALDRPGIPVESAKTNFQIATNGVYRIWIRTKNWLKKYAPGRLKMSIDGEVFKKEIGTQPNGKWYWELAGDINLSPGTHIINVEDNTGYFGRFADIVITDDYDYVPEHDVIRMRKERAIIRGENLDSVNLGYFDLIVAGAGPGGVPTAIAAARKGLKVALISARSGLGGNASDEGTVGLDGAASHHYGMREGGIAEEIRRCHDAKNLSWEGAMTELVNNEKNISVFYNLFIIDAEVHNNKIEKVYALNGIEVKIYTLSGTFFSDCTGDGWLGYYSGAKYRIGREARHEFDESLAPIEPDGNTMSGCIMGTYHGNQVLGYYAEDVGHPVPFQAPEWAIKLPEGDDLHREPGRLTSGEWWVENTTDWDDLWDQEVVRDELLRLNLGYFHWIKNSYRRKKLTRNLEIKSFGKYNARRENRRLVGDCILTEKDCVNGIVFEDAISYCGWSLDVHHPRGIYSGAEGPFYSDVAVKLCTIPYRCLYSTNICNLFFAGRCISVSHLALGTVRVESTLATLGQAVGTAAALCVKERITPRDVYTDKIVTLQQILLRDDLYIPGVTNLDTMDVARRAKVEASSKGKIPYQCKRGVIASWESLGTDIAMSCNYEKSMDRVELMLKNESDEERQLVIFLLKMEGSGQFEKASAIEKITTMIPGKFEGYFPVEFTDTIKGKSFKSIGIKINAVADVFWQKIDYCSDGRRRGKPLKEGFWETDSSNSMIVNFSKENVIYADTDPEQVINGSNRIMSEKIYAWQSDNGLPQWLDLEWEDKQQIEQIVLTLDTDMANPSYSYLSRKTIPDTIKDFDVLCEDSSGSLYPVANVTDNFMRKVIININKIKTRRLRVKVNSTWGKNTAKIIEVRVYENKVIDSVIV